MANWQNRIDIAHEYTKLSDGNMEPEDAGKAIAHKIQQLPCYQKHQNDLEAIAQQFETAMDEEEFDNALDQLYNWGDTNHRLWIQTI